MREFSLESYDYHLPQDLIAKYPLLPKEDAKLLVFHKDTQAITHTTFRSLFDFIPRDYLFVFNNTKVIKARVFGKKVSGAKIEILFHRNIDEGFLVQIRGRVKSGDLILLEQNYSAKVLDVLENGYRIIECFYKDQKIKSFFEMCDLIGHVPLPPYIKREDEVRDSLEYQSVFAKYYGAIAAPTASLHFSDAMMDYVNKNYQNTFLTLHVGAGTFAGVECEDIRDHKIHSETLIIDNQTMQKIKEANKVLCVGTTAMRSVEFLARKNVKEYEGECDIFLHLGNLPIKTSALLTNFHLPKSTLIMLVSSMVGLDTCMKIYNEAIKKSYRFYSYGDGMLII
ncbi:MULTISPECIES: tRNA preQ1(34) S-adenosylmethionine ribosyltransferase-isomerase QueA [unclassified Helicobacter]|uniref:tRNA preQ1(34) S-adenosylmethionine ribosyltransferase-isomerase QueA n=1 Tax=unclassified Helicobacter TaxID=2593540 RepID=UPI000CF166C9|nr:MULTISPECIES: tRNA preQ1(34) S-adenosylmethionine ribosyltransferase-isomerase QueA [unclassified Helicobacter]